MTVKSLDMNREADHVDGVGESLQVLAHHELADGRIDEARSLFYESLELRERLDSVHEIARIDDCLARIALLEGDLVGFESYMHRAVVGLFSIDAEGWTGPNLDGLALAATRREDGETAARYLGASDNVRAETGTPRLSTYDLARPGGFFDNPPLVSDAAMYAEATERARETIGDAAFETAYASTRDSAMEEVLRAVADERTP
jgi:hypothetical protein